MSYEVEPGGTVDVEAVLNHNETTKSLSDYFLIDTNKPDFKLTIPKAVTDAGVTASPLATAGFERPVTLERVGPLRKMTWNAKTTFTVPANYLDFEHPNPIEGQIVASKQSVKSRATVKAIYSFNINVLSSLLARMFWEDVYTGEPKEYFLDSNNPLVSSKRSGDETVDWGEEGFIQPSGFPRDPTQEEIDTSKVFISYADRRIDELNDIFFFWVWRTNVSAWQYRAIFGSPIVAGFSYDKFDRPVGEIIDYPLWDLPPDYTEYSHASVCIGPNATDFNHPY